VPQTPAAARQQYMHHAIVIVMNGLKEQGSIWCDFLLQAGHSLI
jgi:hypothetical protein